MVTGNVVQDRQPDGSWLPGGPSLYSARMARALGAYVTLVTGLPDVYNRDALEGLTLVAVPATSCPVYENRYGGDGQREQFLHHEGSPLNSVDWQAIAAPDLLIIAPAFREFRAPPACAAPVRSVALQGVLRERRDDGRIAPRRDALAAARSLVSPGDLAFLSEEDTEDPVGLATALAHDGAIVLVTRAEHGATLFAGERADDFAAIPAHVVDPTGAGDCFATAFAVRFTETRSLVQAMQYGLAAGSLAVEGRGIAGIPTRGAVESRARQAVA